MREASIRFSATVAFLGATCVVLSLMLAGCGPSEKSPAKGKPAAEPTQSVPVEKPDQKTGGGEQVAVGTCDGQGTAMVSENARGHEMADALMAQWKYDHPERDWVAEEKKRHAFQPPADNAALLQGDQGKGHPYGNYTQRDLLIWARETEKLVAEGSRIFHDAEALGSTVAVSCDMCHPHAANTHPETYPKFQTQLGRVALLRDMIEWCVENPVRGEHMEPDGPRMRALEAYIMAQGTGREMQYGKH